MSSAVAELDGILQSMLNLKSPGVSASKITAITNLCNANVQSESVLIQKIYTHFKKTPGTHKLGVLYVVDSVTRQWVDHAKKSGQALNSSPDGTYAAGVTRVTELLPVLMDDIINAAPEDQKVKIKKLIDIWERSNTFPTAMLSSIKAKLDAPRKSKQNRTLVQTLRSNVYKDDSTTPVGSPSPGFVPLSQPLGGMPAAPAQQQDTTKILEALKNIAKQTNTPQPAPATPMPNLAGLLGANPSAGTVNPGPSASNAQSVNPLGALFAGMNNPTQAQQLNNVPANPLAALMAQQQPQAPTPQQNAVVGSDYQAQAQLIQLMIAQGIPYDQWGTALQLLNMQNQGANGHTGNLPMPLPGAMNGWPGHNGDASRDRDGMTRSPPGRFRQRSRSPGFDRRREQSPRRRRDSPSYDGYRDGRRGNDYRQRSPRRRRSPSPQQNEPNLPPPGPKYIQFDKGMPSNHIKVLSRTLFVGGVTSNEQHLRSLFGKFGLVQTCIVNVDKRHAFIKMINRKDAEGARYGMEEYKDGNTQLRTKWGVGFGPRDCSDYGTGVSIIPIDRLTEADRKWLLTAEYGGTGGQTIEHGMIVEEPDIEIGAGVSSKGQSKSFIKWYRAEADIELAMSRRIPTDKGGQRGPQSSRIGGGRDGRYRDDDQQGDDNNQQPAATGMSGMPFPFASMPNGMPMLPGFPFSFPQNGQQ